MVETTQIRLGEVALRELKERKEEEESMMLK